eukprot:CAMPEP_0185188352 /NCGR_PEP_ID=MMETSP1140-20130426/5348_1 /TAXON_ID=298111 /ORGANISM="Pavlova sp., Strain CCMP459" /LENGTH=203 /DNA_ID=CAMNT_0027754841 /DNA_START=334 /DNA_END=943 /DNA_ORIENTATION=+
MALCDNLTGARRIRQSEHVNRIIKVSRLHRHSIPYCTPPRTRWKSEGTVCDLTGELEPETAAKARWSPQESSSSARTAASASRDANLLSTGDGCNTRQRHHGVSYTDPLRRQARFHSTSSLRTGSARAPRTRAGRSAQAPRGRCEVRLAWGPQSCGVKQEGKDQNNSTRTSPLVPHATTTLAVPRLTSEFGWDPVCSGAYGRC